MAFTEFKAQFRRLLAGLALALAGSGTALAVPEWNLQSPVTPIAHQMYDLHTFIFWICVVIFVAVFGVMFYSMFRHRKSLGHQAHPFHENTIVEIVWTVIPFLILLFMAFPATKTILAMKDTSAPGLTIKVTGLPVELELRLSAGRLRFLLATSPRPLRRSRIAHPRVNTTCSRSITRWSCRSTPRCAS